MKRIGIALNHIDIFAKEVKFRIDSSHTPKRLPTAIKKQIRDEAQSEEEEVDEKPRRMNVSKISTMLGGTITLVTMLMCSLYAYGRFATMFGRSETRIVNYEFNKFKKDTYMLSNYNDSANFILGTSNKSLDIFNNRYIEINAYEMNEDFFIKESTKLDMRLCKREELLIFMPEAISWYYPNSVCFKDRSKVRMRGNWFDSTFESPIINIEECKNTTENGHKCMPQYEIERFMNENIFYFIGQRIMVDPEKYAANSSYFPLQNLVNSKLYDTIGYKASNPLFPIYEIRYGEDVITIDDSFL